MYIVFSVVIFFSLCVIIPTIHYCRVSVRLRKLPLPPCASSTKPKFALIWGPGKKRERRDKLDENVNNDKGFISLRTARKWKAIGLERSSNGIGGDVRRRRHCAHGAKQRTCEDGNKIPKCAHPEDEVEDEEHILDEFGTTFDSHGLDLRSGKCSVVEKLAACVRRVEALTTGLFETHRHTQHSSRKQGNTQLLPPSFHLHPSLPPAKAYCGELPLRSFKIKHFFYFFPHPGFCPSGLSSDRHRQSSQIWCDKVDHLGGRWPVNVSEEFCHLTSKYSCSALPRPFQP